MATMVSCNSCRTVVWAYDHLDIALSGIINHLKLPCPKCGEVQNFDGRNYATHRGEDGWDILHRVADRNGLTWSISPDCAWFHRPDMDSTDDISRMLKKDVRERDVYLMGYDDGYQAGLEELRKPLSY